MLGRPAVTDHQARPAGLCRALAGGPVRFQALQGQAVPGGPGNELPLGVRTGQLEDGVQPGSDPGDVQVLAAQGGGQARLPSTS